MMDIVFILMFFVLLAVIYIIYRRQREEIAVLREKFSDVSQNIPAIVEGAVSKTFQSSAGVLESLFASAMYLTKLPLMAVNMYLSTLFDMVKINFIFLSLVFLRR